MTDLEKTTGLKIRALRQKLGHNQRKIAQQLGISVPAYSKIETGITDVNLTRLAQIASFFGVHPSALLPGVDENELVKANYQRYQQEIEELKSRVILLQTKLIKSYQELEAIRTLQ